MSIDVEALLASVRIEDVVGHYTTLTKRGAEFVSQCLWHSPDSNPSLSVVPKKRMVYCFACGQGGSAIDVVMQAEGLDFQAACARLNGGAPADGWAPRVKAEPARAPDPERITETPPADAPSPKFDHRDFGAPTRILPFKDAAGTVLGFEARWEREDGKESRMLTWGRRGTDKPRWTWAHFSAPRPLYGLDALAAMPQAQVIIFEGPIKADDARDVFPNHARVSWSGGARSWHRTDWSPLAGRSVVLWGDADEPGWKAANELARLLADPKGLACPVVKVVDGNRMPDGWDVRDALAEGWEPARIIEWLRDGRLITINGEQASGSSPIAAATDVDASVPDSPPTDTPPELPESEPADPPKEAIPAGEPSPAADSQQPGGVPTPETREDAASEALASMATPIATAPAARKARKPRLAVVDGNTARAPDPEDAGKPDAFPLSPDAIAEAFAEAHAEDWRYVNEWSRWLSWEGDTWRPDKTDDSFQRMREICRSACYWPEAAASTAKEKRALTYRSYIGGALFLAGRDRRIAAKVEDWDRDPLMLGIPGGAVDLRVGKVVEGAREQMISRRASVEPVAGPCPLWQGVLERAARGDSSLTAYLQRMAGYLATGETKEECFFFVYGPGASGKSTFVRVLAEVLGDYAQAASMEAFMARDRAEHSTEIARMAGARMISATETDEGARLNESRIKSLTGRDRISARFMRGDLFDFQPTAKIILCGNHKPQLRSVGEEMKRRIHLIEFPETIPEEDRDRALPEKLTHEYPAILAWIIQGALLWLDCGLGRPEAIETATKDYLQGEDTIGAWIEDCVIVGDGRVQSGEAYRSFSAWAEKQGEYVPSQKRFVQRIADRGFTLKKSGARYIEGLRLRGLMDPAA